MMKNFLPIVLIILGILSMIVFLGILPAPETRNVEPY